MHEPGGTRGEGSLCIVRHSYYPSELSVRREAEALVEYGYDVHVVCLRQRGEAAREVVNGVRVRRLPVEHRRGRIGRYLFEYNVFLALASLELLRLHFRHRLRAVQVNTMPDYLVFATLPLRLAGVKVVLHMHEPMPELFGTLFTGWYRRPLIAAIKVAERRSLAYADRALTVTREMRENFGRRGANLEKITVVVNVPDDRVFSSERYSHIARRVAMAKVHDRPEGIFRIVCHGAIEERYGLDVVVRAVARVKSDIPGVQFRFMGQGDYLDEVLTLAQRLDVSAHVRHLGFVPFEAMLEEILAADLAVVPMQRNPYSVLVHTNKMYEYMALGRPVVASRLDSVAAYFPADAILYFEPGDDADLAERLRYALARPEEMARRAEAASRIYQQYRWDREKKKYLAVYDALLSTGSSER